MKCYFNEQRLHSAASLAARLYTVWWDQCRLAVCHKLNWSSTEHMIALPLKGNLYAERPDAEIMTYFRLAVTAIWQMNGWAVMNNEVTCPLKIKERCWGHQLQNSCYWMIVQCKCGLDRPLRVFVINQSLLLLNSTISHSILSARLPCEKPPCDVSPYLNYSQITDTPPPTPPYALVLSPEETENHFTAEKISPLLPLPDTVATAHQKAPQWQTGSWGPCSDNAQLQKLMMRPPPPTVMDFELSLCKNIRISKQIYIINRLLMVLAA